MFNKRNIIIESNIWNQQNREMLIIFIFTFLFLILVFYTIYFDQTFCPTRISSLSFPNSQSAQIHILSLSEKKKKQNRQATTTNTWNTHPEMGMYLSNPSRLRTPCERGSRKIIRAKVGGDSKETVFSDTAELTHIWTHRDGDSLNRTCTDAQTQAKQNANTERRKRAQSPISSQEAIPNW